jgi:alkanesulfonate monooxygenase SsuD/methylene tetrahydromethanopterin reductase-like flavin-dependent oxidoreductase (luciferase family)
MRIGLALPHYDFSIPGVSPIRFEALAEVAVRAERLGFDSVWMSDHLFATLGREEADELERVQALLARLERPGS